MRGVVLKFGCRDLRALAAKCKSVSRVFDRNFFKSLINYATLVDLLKYLQTSIDSCLGKDSASVCPVKLHESLCSWSIDQTSLL